MAIKNGWKAEEVHSIGPFKKDWPSTWHSVGRFLGITSFGVNATTKNKGEKLTPEHDELTTGQQELLVVIEGKAEFSMNGKSFVATPGCLVAAEPEVKRSAIALEDNTTMLSVGAKPGEAYKLGDY